MVGWDSSSSCRVLGRYPSVEQVGVALESEGGDITPTTAKRFVERDWSRLRISLDLGRNPRERQRDDDRRRSEEHGGESLFVVASPHADGERVYNRGQIRYAHDEIEGTPSDWNGHRCSKEWVAHYPHRVKLVMRDHKPEDWQSEKHNGPQEPDPNGRGPKGARPPRHFDIG